MSENLMTVDLRQKIQKIEGNSKCVDCGSDFPTWASLTFGILICYNCAGFHRGLGVNHSFVKSLNLDFWDRKSIDYMLDNGNDKFIKYIKQITNQSSKFNEKLYKSNELKQYNKQ
ncbi:MAG: Zn finger-containing GTPase- Activating Protein for ARF [Marteilia pararefringens]